MKTLISGVTRPDNSINDLRSFKLQGYETVVFVANIEADPQCEHLNGNIYDIDELLTLDSPIFRISHPNCRCKFSPYGKSKNKNQEQTHTPTTIPTEKQIPETQNTTNTHTKTAPTTQTTPTTQNNTETQNKNPWYKKWMPWLFKNKQSDFRSKILKRAANAKRIRK